MQGVPIIYGSCLHAFRYILSHATFSPPYDGRKQLPAPEGLFTLPKPGMALQLNSFMKPSCELPVKPHVQNLKELSQSHN